MPDKYLTRNLKTSVLMWSQTNQKEPCSIATEAWFLSPLVLYSSCYFIKEHRFQHYIKKAYYCEEDTGVFIDIVFCCSSLVIIFKDRITAIVLMESNFTALALKQIIQFSFVEM